LIQRAAEKQHRRLLRCELHQRLHVVLIPFHL